MVIFRGFLAVEKLIGDAKERTVLENLFLGEPAIWPLGEIAYLHLKDLRGSSSLRRLQLARHVSSG